MKTSSVTTFFSTVVLSFGLCVCSVAAPLREWPVVARGDHNITVRAFQLLLKARGYNVAADGFFESATQKALRRFQHTHQLVAEGEMNNPTWEALVLPIQQGSLGPAVKAAQIELREEGYAVATDGVFSSRMKSVVLRYQKLTGHTADGIIGRNTWCELLEGNQSEGD